MMNPVRRLARFWYDFIVGDDPAIAVVVVILLLVVGLLTQVGIMVWPLLPLAVIAVLGVSVWRAAR